jgi:hypothetical protein
VQHLIERGKKLEDSLDVEGQFHVCSPEHKDSGGERFFNAKVAACAVYSLVFTAWLFMAIRFSFGCHIIGCGLTATVFGGLLAVGVLRVVNERIAS